MKRDQDGDLLEELRARYESSTQLPDHYNRLSGAVIGAAIEVHRHLGPGYLESAYEAAMLVELRLRGVAVRDQVKFPLVYKGHEVSTSRVDLLIENDLLVELKAVENVLPVHRAQLRAYLRATNLRLGLLINFNVAVLRDGIVRGINSERIAETQRR